jgi:hypothetical protein
MMKIEVVVFWVVTSLHPEDVGNMALRNAFILLHHHTVSPPRRPRHEFFNVQIIESRKINICTNFNLHLQLLYQKVRVSLLNYYWKYSP